MNLKLSNASRYHTVAYVTVSLHVVRKVSVSIIPMPSCGVCVSVSVCYVCGLCQNE